MRGDRLLRNENGFDFGFRLSGDCISRLGLIPRLATRVEEFAQQRAFLCLSFAGELTEEGRQAAFERSPLLHGLYSKRRGFSQLPAVGHGDIGASSGGARKIGLLEAEHD